MAAMRQAGRRSVPVWRWVILFLAGVYFLIPLYGALKFSGFSAFGEVVSTDGFTESLWLSVRLALVTTVITLVLMVPTTIYVHLRLPKVRRLLESITILPIVIPPIRTSSNRPLGNSRTSSGDSKRRRIVASPLTIWRSAP